ncbi:hypothetical protein AX15_005372 [Amanita polypyramis BW_CC]|nr:hypothetical protein AX15_005372 [Amanita polypyramis BW_CC]
MATKKAADASLYHLSPKGFWKKFRDAVSVNPSISSGLPIASLNRYPPPGSRPEMYSTPATKASDPAQNPYWKRDVRRAYPQLSVITQPELSSLLIEHSGTADMAIPATQEVDGGSVSSTAERPLDLSQAIAVVTQGTKVYTESKLPPSFPTSYKRWVPRLSPPPPHDPYSYFPMSLYQ